MATKSIREFIKRYRKELDEYIRPQVYKKRLNDSERRQWIDNDQFLYDWYYFWRRYGRY